jgi:hypothetical protein
MKNTLGLSALAMVFALALSFTACDNEAGDADDKDTVGELKVDSNANGADVTADQKEFEFDGTVSSISGDMVTVQHEKIGDYKDSGSSSFKLAHSDMAQYVKAGERKHFTLQVAGEEALITTIEDLDGDDGDTSAARRDTAK